MFKLSEPKIVITDADGTFLKYDTKILNSTEQAISALREKKIILVLATGRGLATYKNIKGIENFDYVIGGSGSFIFERSTNQIIYENFISSDEVSSVLKAAEKENLAWVTETKDLVIYSEKAEKNQHFFYKLTSFGKSCLFNGKQKLEKTSRFLFLPYENINNSQLALIMKSLFDKKKFSIFQSFQTCEMTKKSINKWTAAIFLINFLKESFKNVWAMGDSANDQLLIDNIENSIAMGNALPSIKKSAKYITDRVENHGWAKVFVKNGVINEWN